MSALASLCKDMGMRVTGSDRAFDLAPDHQMRRTLSGKGVAIVPQDGSHPLAGDSLMVVSAAVEEDSPEMLTAKRLGVPVRSRGQYMAELTAKYKTLAVAGTSGKSTTSAWLAYTMGALGLDPSFLGGGRLMQFQNPDNPGNYRRGNSGLLIVEACESDGHLSEYRAEHSIIMNLSLDHLGVKRTLELFGSLALNTTGTVILNADDAALDALAAGTTIKYSIDCPSDMQAENMELSPLGSSFSVHGEKIRTQLPGKHNVYNALATLAALKLYGISPKEAAPALAEFRGIERRFEVHLDEMASGGPLVVDDYAHNPHKISCLMHTMQGISRSVCYIFQPHGFGPTRLMRDEYARVFRQQLRPEDRLVILPIYFAGGTVSQDISSRDLASDVGQDAWAPEFRKQALEKLPLEHGAYVVFGARDDTLSVFARDIAIRVKNKNS